MNRNKEEIARIRQSSGNLYSDETIVNGSSVDDIDMVFFSDFILAKTNKSIQEIGQ